MKTQKALLKVILIFMLVILASLLLLFSIPIGHKAFAEDTTKIFVGQDPSKTLEQKSSELKYNNTVGSKAVLTVLLPDLNEDASAWSRSLIKKFSYNENSLLEILKSDSNGDLYTAIYSNYELYITKLYRTHYVNTFDSNADYYERNFSTYSTAHKIITVSFNKVNEVDDRINFSTAYEETEKLINLVLYDLKKTGVAKPTVNIIGHGRGGTGGKGGKGKFGVHAAKGGTGGTGGAGGDGGAGGNYGSALATLGVTVDFGNASVTKTNGTGGAGGAGGNGGAGGTGGQGGDKWPTGNLADSGATGSRGANGHKGSDG